MSWGYGTMWCGIYSLLCFADTNSSCGCLMCILELLTMYGLFNWWMSVVGKWLWVEAMECMWIGYMNLCLCFVHANIFCWCLMCEFEWLTVYWLSNWWMCVGGKSIWVEAMECIWCGYMYLC
jgi:hypothetical protein